MYDWLYWLSNYLSNTATVDLMSQQTIIQLTRLWFAVGMLMQQSEMVHGHGQDRKEEPVGKWTWEQKTDEDSPK